MSKKTNAENEKKRPIKQVIYKKYKLKNQSGNY